MAGLYERDFSTLTIEESAEKERLDRESEVSGSGSFRGVHIRRAISPCRYPKAVRHNDSLFPNNYIDICELRTGDGLTQQCNAFKSVIDNTASSELDMKRCIQNNGYYHIPASLLKNYRFGHHGAFVFKEFKLGTSYTADYLLVGNASGGYEFVFVECESICGRITIEDGSFGEAINKGLRQIDDWRAYIASNYSSLYDEFKKHTSKTLPEEFFKYDPTRFNYIVIAGRRANFNERTRRLSRQSVHDSQVLVLHYDNWYDDAMAMIGKSTY